MIEILHDFMYQKYKGILAIWGHAKVISSTVLWGLEYIDGLRSSTVLGGLGYIDRTYFGLFEASFGVGDLNDGRCRPVVRQAATLI